MLTIMCSISQSIHLEKLCSYLKNDISAQIFAEFVFWSFPQRSQYILLNFTLMTDLYALSENLVSLIASKIF